MKFYMAMKTRPNNSPLPLEQEVSILQASREFVNARIQDGRFDCAYGYVHGEGFCVANAESPEALMADLLSFPAFPRFNWEIVPLVEFNASYDAWIAFFKERIG